MPCTCSKNPQHALQRRLHYKLRGLYPIGAQLNGVAIAGYAESSVCDPSTDITVVLYDQEVRHRIVR